MKARGIYVYGVWCPECGWGQVFDPDKSTVVRHKNEKRDYAGCPDTITVKRVYIPAPKGTK